MSQRCNLSTSAERDSVSARSPPIQPTPITAASTVFTARSLPYLLLAHKNHDETECANSLLALRGAISDEAIQFLSAFWIASRSHWAGHFGPDPLARNDEKSGRFVNHSARPGVWIPGSELRSAPEWRPN